MHVIHDYSCPWPEVQIDCANLLKVSSLLKSALDVVRCKRHLHLHLPGEVESQSEFIVYRHIAV